MFTFCSRKLPTLGIYYTDTSREIDRLSRDKLSMPPGMKGILCIKFDLFKIKNTDFWAAYGNSSVFEKFTSAYLSFIDPERGVFAEIFPEGNIITEGNHISPNTPSGGSINELHRKTKLFMQNLNHKRVHILLSVLTHDIL